MTDHTPGVVDLPTWLPVTGEAPLVRYDWDRVKACLDACAGIPTTQLEDAKALVEVAETIAERPIAGPDDGTKEDFMSELNSMIKKARAALAPFRED